MAIALERNARVGIVDDEEMFAESLAYVLTTFYGCEVSIAVNAPAAEQLVREKQLDALLLDFHMPGVEGEKLVRRLREIAPELVIWVLTGNTSGRARQSCLDAGANGVLRKGLGLDAIVNALPLPEPVSI